MELWMQPRSTSGQRVVSFDLDVSPVAEVFSYADCWGNTVSYFDVPYPHDQLTITARTTVETDAQPPAPDALDQREWDALRSEGVRGECWDFLRPHGFAVRTPVLDAFCLKHGVDDIARSDPLTAVRDLNALLYRSFAYETGVTAVDSPIDEAILAGQGVCQDFAHIMIAVCRSWDIPARYVSGYLHTNQDDGDRSDPDASHAWIEVFLPSLRWIGFDPTNNILAGERHVTVAIGRDYSDTPPSRGVFKGEAESRLSIGVSVRQEVGAASEPEFLRLGAPAIAAARRRASTAALLDQHHQQQQ
jgi:transglutaminase-like putative cysteine protease